MRRHHGVPVMLRCSRQQQRQQKAHSSRNRRGSGPVCHCLLWSWSVSCWLTDSVGGLQAISKEQLAAAAPAAADEAAAGVLPPRPPPGGPPSSAAAATGAGPAAAGAPSGAVPPPRPPAGTPPKAAAAADTNAEGTRVVSPAQRTDEATNAEMSNAEGSQRAGDVMQLTAAYSSRGRAAAGTGVVTA